MREISFDREFDAALNLFSSIGYFDDDFEDRKIFDRVFRSLKEGGSFVLDFINRDHYVRNFRERWERELSDGSVLITEPCYDIVRGRNVARRSVVPKGCEAPKAIATLDYRIYSPPELVAMGSQAGFRLKKSFGDFDGSPLTINSGRVILFFERP
jgi:SAM-dependent methyltransferase